jgi:DNA-binding CsgD family transcriptional regulator
VIFLGWSVSALVTALWIEDFSGYRHRKTAISTEFSQLRSTATGSYSNFGLGLASQAGVAESAPPPSDAALTDGETRVLHYLPTNLSAREIAGELYLSVNTVKTQQHLYQNSARAAVPRPSSRPAPSACSHHSSRRRR